MFRLALILFLFSQIIFANSNLDKEIEKKVANFCLYVLAYEEGHYNDLNAINVYTDEDMANFMKKRYPNFVSDIHEEEVSQFCIRPQVIYQDYINRLFIYRQAANIIEVVKPQVIYQDYINRLFIYRQAANSCGEDL